MILPSIAEATLSHHTTIMLGVSSLFCCFGSHPDGHLASTLLELDYFSQQFMR